MLKFRETFHSFWVGGGNLLNSYLKMNCFHFRRGIMRSGLDARSKSESLGGQPLVPLLWPPARATSPAGELPRAGLGPPAPYNRGLRKIWELPSELGEDRTAKFQRPGVRSQAGSGSGSTSFLLCVASTTFISQSQFSHLLMENSNLSEYLE